MKTVIVLITASCLSSAAGFQNGGRPLQLQYHHRVSALEMKPSAEMKIEEGSGTGRRFGPVPQDRSQIMSLSVATLEDVESLPQSASLIPQLNIPKMGSVGNLDAVGKVLSASLLITGNTVGPSMFVLPDAVGGVGMMYGSGIFFGLYIYNLISGLLLTDVAINLHESSDCEVPSSFKDFVDTAFKSETAGTVMAGASLISNSCFLAFGTVHAGTLLANTFPELGLEPIVGAGAFAATIAAFSLTQTNKGLEKIANAACLVLFSSFASLLLPSMANVSDPMGTLLTPGTNPDGFGAIAAALPLVLSSLTYQNIVPSVAKILDFDRTKSTIAVAIGSFLPVAMYVAWCYAALGGGLDSSTASGAGAAAFTAFSASALVGSSVAAVMSLAEEYESILPNDDQSDDDQCTLKNKFSLPTVAASMVPPVAIALAFSGGGDLTGALHFNGAIITPVLYGLLPIVLYQSTQKIEDTNDASSPMSWGNVPQALLGAGTVAALGQELVQDLASLPNMMA